MQLSEKSCNLESMTLVHVNSAVIIIQQMIMMT